LLLDPELRFESKLLFEFELPFDPELLLDPELLFEFELLCGPEDFLPLLDEESLGFDDAVAIGADVDVELFIVFLFYISIR
jgi:hypothetical protein